MVAFWIILIFGGLCWLVLAERKRERRFERYREWEEKMFAEEKERDRILQEQAEIAEVLRSLR